MCEILFNIINNNNNQTLGGGQLSLPTNTIPTTKEDLQAALHLPVPSAAQIADIKNQQRLIPGSSALEVLQKIATHFVSSFRIENIHVIFFDENAEQSLGLSLRPYPTEHKEEQPHPSPQSLN